MLGLEKLLKTLGPDAIPICEGEPCDSAWHYVTIRWNSIRNKAGQPRSLSLHQDERQSFIKRGHAKNVHSLHQVWDIATHAKGQDAFTDAEG